MRLRLLLVLVCVTGMAVTEGNNTVVHFATAVMNAFGDIVKSGGEIWTRLGEGQALAVLQNLASEAATLEGQKSALREKLVDAAQTNGTVDISEEVEPLKKSVRDMASTLERFRVEVDSAAHPIGEQLRVELSKAETGKVIDLDRVVGSWRDGKKDEAIRQLDAAVLELQKMRKAIVCLQDSINKKGAACDPVTLKHH